MSRADLRKGQPSERPQWIVTLRDGAIFMLIGSPLVALHIASLWSQGNFRFLDMLAAISVVNRGYLISLTALGCGLCLVLGALIEAVCIAITRR